MTLTWGDYKDQLRRSILKDVEGPSVPKWDDNALRDFCWWSLDALCSHTAQVTAAQVTGINGTATTFSLPENIYDWRDAAVMLYTTSVGDYKASYLQSSRTHGQFRIDNTNSYYLRYPFMVLTDQLSNVDLYIQYFALYNHPYTDSDTIDVPVFLQSALSYMIGAHALAAPGVRAANIRQWGTKPDTGQPEHNPLRAQHEFFIRVYEQELARHPRQDRTNLFNFSTVR